MKMRPHKTNAALMRRRGGFTLIEIIATLVLSSILVALTLPLISSGLQGNRRPLLRMPATYSLRSEMDVLWQLYRSDHPTDLSGLATAIAADPPASYTAPPIWVDFDAAGFEFETAPGTENVLRLTLANAQGERLTTYFFPIL